ncbi:MAG: YaeQ family protein [Thermoflexales bacterium]|nr:YaeQ family protein [Thermoflexales bacterium]
MALSATLHTYAITLSDIDRGVYAALSLKVAQHPAESMDYMLTRVLAYGMEYTDDLAPHIAFGRSVGTEGGEEPAVWARDYAGELLLWVEVGLPSVDKLRKAVKAARRVAVYTHRDPGQLARAFEAWDNPGATPVPLVAFERGFLAQMAERLDRRADFGLTVSDGHLYLDIAGQTLETQPRRLAL